MATCLKQRLASGAKPLKEIIAEIYEKNPVVPSKGPVEKIVKEVHEETPAVIDFSSPRPAPSSPPKLQSDRPFAMIDKSTDSKGAPLDGSQSSKVVSLPRPPTPPSPSVETPPPPAKACDCDDLRAAISELKKRMAELEFLVKGGVVEVTDTSERENSDMELTDTYDDSALLHQDHDDRHDVQTGDASDDELAYVDLNEESRDQYSAADFCSSPLVLDSSPAGTNDNVDHASVESYSPPRSDYAAADASIVSALRSPEEDVNPFYVPGGVVFDRTVPDSDDDVIAADNSSRSQRSLFDRSVQLLVSHRVSASAAATRADSREYLTLSRSQRLDLSKRTRTIVIHPKDFPPFDQDNFVDHENEGYEEDKPQEVVEEDEDAEYGEYAEDLEHDDEYTEDEVVEDAEDAEGDGYVEEDKDSEGLEYAEDAGYAEYAEDDEYAEGDEDLGDVEYAEDAEHAWDVEDTEDAEYAGVNEDPEHIADLAGDAEGAEYPEDGERIDFGDDLLAEMNHSRPLPGYIYAEKNLVGAPAAATRVDSRGSLALSHSQRSNYLHPSTQVIISRTDSWPVIQDGREDTSHNARLAKSLSGTDTGRPRYHDEYGNHEQGQNIDSRGPSALSRSRQSNRARHSRVTDLRTGSLSSSRQYTAARDSNLNNSSLRTPPISPDKEVHPDSASIPIPACLGPISPVKANETICLKDGDWKFLCHGLIGTGSFAFTFYATVTSAGSKDSGMLAIHKRGDPVAIRVYSIEALEDSRFLENIQKEVYMFNMFRSLKWSPFFLLKTNYWWIREDIGKIFLLSASVS